MRIKPDIQQLLPYITTQRRLLHRMPEPGYQEHDTRAHLWQELQAAGVDKLDTFAQTGIRAVVFAQSRAEKQKVLAFRADIDALSITEETGLDFASERVGFMHACGHDGHMSILLAFARWLCAHRDIVTCDTVLLFQPAEESIGGALPMIQEGALNDPDVDMVFGLHVMPEVPAQRIGLLAGPAMASTSELTIDVTGRSAHGAMPHRGVDAIVAAAHFITMVQTIPTRNVEPHQRALITIGKITGGERGNVLAERVRMKGTLRTFDDDVCAQVKARIQQQLDSLAPAFGAGGHMTIDAEYPAVINHEAAVACMMAVLDPGDHFPMQPMMIAEDFSWFQRHVPGAYCFLGIQKPGCDAPLHSNRFNLDEADLLPGVELYSRLVTA